MGDWTRSHPPAGRPHSEAAACGKNRAVRLPTVWPRGSFSASLGQGHLAGERRPRESPPSSAVVQAAAECRPATPQWVGVPEKTTRLPGTSKSAFACPPKGRRTPTGAAGAAGQGLGPRRRCRQRDPGGRPLGTADLGEKPLTSSPGTLVSVRTRKGCRGETGGRTLGSEEELLKHRERPKVKVKEKSVVIEKEKKMKEISPDVDSKDRWGE